VCAATSETGKRRASLSKVIRNNKNNMYYETSSSDDDNDQDRTHELFWQNFSDVRYREMARFYLSLTDYERYIWDNMLL
jgi:hypothetical protein